MIHQRTIFQLIIVFLINSISSGQVKAGKYLPGEFGTLIYDKVVAFDFVSKNWQQIVAGKKLNDSITVRKEITLTRQQIDALNAILFNTKTYGAYPPSCFNNHFGVVYYHGTKIVGYLSISFDCNSVSPSLGIDAMKNESFHDKKYEFAYYSGLSKQGHLKLMQLCDELGFSYPKPK